MENLYWIGIRESEIKYCKDFFEESVTIFGNNNISMQKELKKVIDHNNINNFDLIDDFFNKQLKKIISSNPNAKFMYYSQIYSYDSVKKLGLLNHVICFNNQRLINYLSDKFKLKELFKGFVPILNYKFLDGNKCSYNNIKREFQKDDKSYVIQTATGSGGSGTIIINKENENEIELNKKEIFMVTEYCENNIPINMHVLISSSNIILLPASIQIIKVINNKLEYMGCDYIAYRDISIEIKNKFEKYISIIAKKMQSMGYRGICGIDSIIYKNEIYLMEINTRFQNSSTILNKSLVENNLPSLQEFNIKCFKDEKIDLIKFNVNYSCLLLKNGCKLSNSKIKSIEMLDNISGNIDKETSSYTGSLIYNESIFKLL